jgi:hypothetical protein
VLSRQRLHLLGELRSLAELRRQTGEDPIVALLLTAAELHVRADLELVDAAEEADLWRASLAAAEGTAEAVAHPPTDLEVTEHG